MLHEIHASCVYCRWFFGLILSLVVLVAVVVLSNRIGLGVFRYIYRSKLK